MTPTLTERILDRAHNAAVSMDADGRVTYWNPSAERAFGISRERAIGQPVAELIIPERLRAAHREGLRRFLSDGVGPVLDQRMELAALRADGTEFPVEITISALQGEDGWLFHAFIEDISERRSSEQENRRLVEELRHALQGSQRRFDAIVGSLSDAVTIRDRQDRIVYANRAALAYLGFDSQAELETTDPAEIMADYDVSREDGGPVTMDDIPSVRLLRGQEAEPLLLRAVHRGTGQLRWSLLKSAPVRDESGATEATIMIIEDVTERKRAERRGLFLAQAGEMLASSLDYEQTLRNVAQLAVPEVADWCAVDLIDSGGDRVSVAVAHVDPDRLVLAEELRRYEPEHPDPEQGLGLVFRTGKPQLYSDITDEMIAAGALNAEHLRLLRAVGFRSAALVPMRIGTEVLGCMTLVTAESGRRLDASDVELAEQVAARAAVAIENSRLYSERSRIAHTLQQSLLPDQLPEVPGYELATTYLPAVAGSDVGGDFYDVWEVGGAWMVLIGDVTGKGVQAAALTSLVRHTVKAASEYESSPAGLLARVDSVLKKQGRMAVCTALCLRIEGAQVQVAGGGHPLPLIIGDGGVEPLVAHGPLLGALPDVQWTDVSVALAPGSTLIAYTDGVTDAIGEGRTRFGTARLADMLGRCRDRSAAAVVKEIIAAVAEFQVGPPADDTAVLAIHRTLGAREDERGAQTGAPNVVG